MRNITNIIFHPFKYSKYKQTFVELSKKYKKGVDKFITDNGFDEIKTFEDYETIYENSEVIIEYNSTITKYESLCRKYKKGVVEIVGNDCSIATMKLALSKKREIKYANNILTQFIYIYSHFTKGVYSFYHSTTRNYSFRDKEKIVNKAEFIKNLDKLVKTALYCESKYPAAWLKFNDNSLKKISIYSISYDKLRTINTSHFEIKNKFLFESKDFSQTKINLIIGCASHDLLSFDESTILEEKYFLDYISSCSIAQIENLSLECHFDDKIDFIRTIYYSSEYGDGVKFVDTYSYNSFYQLGKLIESCDTTFDDIYYFRKDNADAVKAYNKKYSGKESFFIEDFELIAKKDVGLINFINDFNAEKKRKQEEERKESERKIQERLAEVRRKEAAELAERNRLNAINEQKKVDAAAILRYLNDNGVRCFYHFTDRRNLVSIKKHGGLLSWWYCKQNDITIPNAGGDSDSRMLDCKYNLQNYVRVSFCDDHPMAYRCYQEGGDLVLLKISTEVATFKDTIFCDMNATANGHSKGLDYEALLNVDINTTKEHYLRKDDPSFKPHQAEVMINTFIPIRYILNIDNPQTMIFG